VLESRPVGEEEEKGAEEGESQQGQPRSARRARFAATDERRRILRSQLAGLKRRATLKQQLQ
jgi:hypothetical protein